MSPELLDPDLLCFIITPIGVVAGLVLLQLQKRGKWKRLADAPPDCVICSSTTDPSEPCATCGWHDSYLADPVVARWVEAHRAVRQAAYELRLARSAAQRDEDGRQRDPELLAVTLGDAHEAVEQALNACPELRPLVQTEGGLEGTLARIGPEIRRRIAERVFGD